MSVKSPSRSIGSFQMSEISGKSGKSGKLQVSPEQKLDEINQKLAEVRRKRLEFEAGSSSSTTKKSKNKSKTAKSASKTDTKALKKSFHHPKLDYVLAEIVYSPYMTKPNESYSQETFRIPEKLSELKKKASKLEELPAEDQPFDLEEVKGRFLNEVANYNVSFVMPVSLVVLCCVCLEILIWYPRRISFPLRCERV